MSRRAPRVWVRVLGCIAAGALLTVAAAWIPAAVWGTPGNVVYGPGGMIRRGDEIFFWHRTHPPRLGAREIALYQVADVADGHQGPPSLPPPDWAHVGRSFAGMHTFGYGEPAVSLRRIVPAGSGEAYLSDLRGGLKLDIGGRDTVLPTLIHWPGFALDTAFYGTIVFLLWSAPGFAKRISRRRRGLCLACGYELKGLEKCPECGGGKWPKGQTTKGPNRGRGSEGPGALRAF